eukprot:INCI12959.1.p1 GENE.INCI12959.1~~INCI12959.1.p1  ORF type:complete len:240 (+),score=29.18 INCI12959.1:116-835(+)
MLVANRLKLSLVVWGSDNEEQVSPATLVALDRSAPLDGRKYPTVNEPRSGVRSSPVASSRATEIEPPQASATRNVESHSVAESIGDPHSGDEEEVWDVDAPDTGVELWVPPSQQHAYLTVQVQVAACGSLGIEFRCYRRGRSGRQRRRSGQCHRLCRPPFVAFQNGIIVNGFDVKRNPDVTAITESVPVGSYLQLWNGSPVMSAEDLADHVQNMRWDSENNDGTSGATVSLTFALPHAP